MKITYKEFAQKIKAKYPTYEDVDDEKLAKAMIAKYPTYSDSVTFDVAIPEDQSKLAMSQDYGKDNIAPSQDYIQKEYGEQVVDRLSPSSVIEAQNAREKIANSKTWDNASYEGKIDLLKSVYDATDKPKTTNQIADLIATAPYSVKDIYLKNTSIGKGLVSGAKDILSAPGRVVASAGNELYNNAVNENKDDFGERFQRGLATTSEATDNIGGAMVRDPLNIPAALSGLGLAKYASKIPLATNLATKSPKIMKATGLAVEGIGDEGSRQIVNQDFDPTQLAIAGGMSGAIGAGAGALKSKGRSLFSELPTNTSMKRLGSEADGALDLTYENLPYKGQKDYNIKQRLSDIGTGKAILGESKGGAYEGLEGMSRNISSDVMPKDYGREFVQNKINTEVKKSVDDAIYKGGISDQADYLNNLQKMKDDFLLDYGKINMPEGASPEEAANILSGLAEEMKSVPQKYKDDLNKLFRTRIQMDKSLTKAYDKVAGGVKLTDKEASTQYGRDLINDEINLIIEKIGENIEPNSPDFAKYTELVKSLEPTKKLPSLYRQEKVLSNIGGGMVEKSSPYTFGRTNYVKNAITPPSGIRQRQAGEVLDSPIFRAYMREQEREFKE